MEREVRGVQIFLCATVALFLGYWYVTILTSNQQIFQKLAESRGWFGQVHRPAPATDQVVHLDRRDVEALALNLYHETRGLRGPNDTGWRSVAAVVFNRLEDPRFPKTIRGVIYQRNNVRGTCEFSWYCDGNTDVPRNSKLYRATLRAAEQYLLTFARGEWVDTTGGAHSYHATTIPQNRYFEGLRVTKVIWDDRGGHYFYGDR